MSQGLFGRLAKELEAREKAAGLSMADILDLPDAPRKLVTWLMRKQQARLAEVLARLGGDETAARALLADLIERGFIREMAVRGEQLYQVRIKNIPGRQVPQSIWDSINTRMKPGTEE
jgi:hypothetical protein